MMTDDTCLDVHVMHETIVRTYSVSVSRAKGNIRLSNRDRLKLVELELKGCAEPERSRKSMLLK